MIKVFFLIFEPVGAWERIAAARRSVGFILATYLLPTLLIIAALEGWGLATWGKWQPVFQHTRKFSLAEVVAVEIVQFVFSLSLVFFVARVVKNLGGTFRKSNNFPQAFTLVAYSFSPLFLLRLLDALPNMHPAVTCGIGITLTIWVMYSGLPRVLQPDPVHAFGLYLSSIMIMLLAAGVIRVPTALYLLGRVDLQHSSLLRHFSN